MGEVAGTRAHGILETLGRVDAEDVEPLDLEEARDGEDEFWAQNWDEPEDDW